MTKKIYTDQQLEQDITALNRFLAELRSSKSYRMSDHNYDTLSALRVVGWRGVAALMLIRATRLWNLANQHEPDADEVKHCFGDQVNYSFYGLILHKDDYETDKQKSS